MGQVYTFKNPYWREKPLSRTTAIQLLFDWEYPTIWALTGHGTEFVQARIDCYSPEISFDESLRRLDSLMKQVVDEIDLKSGLIAFLELILEPLTDEEAKLFGPMGFQNISEFFGPLSARHPEMAIQTCFGFMHVHEKFLFTPTTKVITKIYPPRPKKWYEFFYKPVPIEKKEVIPYQPASMFKQVLLSVPCPHWVTIASSLIQVEENDTEELLFVATEEQMHSIDRIIPLDHFSLKQYHHMLYRLHQAGLNKYQ